MDDSGPEPDPDEPPTRERRNPSRLVVGLAVAPIVVLTVVANVGNRLYFSMVANHPLLTLAMNPTNIVMATTSPRLSAATYYSVVIVRRLLVDPLYWLLGYWYGDDALRWMKRRSSDLGVLATKLEEWFPKYGGLIVFFYQHPLVILLAGASGMSLARFMLYDLLGTVAAAIAVRHFGEALSPQIDSFVGFLGDHQLAFGILSAVLLAYYVFTLRKQDHGFDDMHNGDKKGGGGDAGKPKHGDEQPPDDNR